MAAFRKEAKNLPMTVSTTNTDHSPAPLKVFLPSDQPAEPELGHPCEELAKSFEAATGWVLGFEESRYSPRDNRGQGIPRLGKIIISDLSADWPPRKPAASRRKCDEMVVAINELYNELTRTKLELQTAQKQAAAVCSVDTIAELIELTELTETVGVESSTESQTTINDLPFAGWQAEVRNHSDSYAGWFVNADEQLVAVSIRSASNDCSTTFVDAVARELSRISPQPILPEMFNQDKVESHLLVNMKVVDAEGEVLATGRSVADLKDQLGAEHLTNEITTDDSDWHQDGLNDWSWDVLPEQVEIKRGQTTVPGFVAIVDQTDGVGLRLLDSKNASQRQTTEGLVRLFAIKHRRHLKSQVNWLPQFDQMAVLISRVMKPATQEWAGRFDRANWHGRKEKNT